jgi:glycosyltransferase involved in cell wall biosynthesis
MLQCRKKFLFSQFCYIYRNNMYKILRIHNRLIVGGPSHNVTLLTAYLSPEFETKLLVGKKDPAEKDAAYIAEQLGLTPVEIPEMRRSVLPFNDIIAYYKIKKIIRQYKPDIVHTHASKSGAIGRMAARACKVPLVVHTFHGHVFHSYFSSFASRIIVRAERFLAKRADAIVAISESQKQELSEVYKIAPAQKIFTVPLGFNLDKFGVNNEVKRNLFRHKYGFAADELVVGIVGRIVPVKNHDMFLEMAAIIKKRTDKNVRFAIIGDGESRQLAEQKAAGLGLSYSYFITQPQSDATVILTSWETEIDQALAGLDIVVLTSHNEGTPVSLIEAQAACKPVVSTDVGGVEDIVLHGETGYITQVGETELFADYVLKLIDDAGLRQQMGQRGRDNVTSKYSRQRLINDMRSLYLSFLNKNK